VAFGGKSCGGRVDPEGLSAEDRVAIHFRDAVRSEMSPNWWRSTFLGWRAVM